MAILEISQHTAEKLQELSDKSHITLDALLIMFINQYHMIETEPILDEDKTWTADEVAEMLKPKQPLTGKEMVEQGLVGGWADMGIEDSLEWLQKQRAKRRKKLQW